jgi:hypothetical protein
MPSPERGRATLRRRDFLGALGGAAAMPLAARAQQAERMRRIGVLAGGDADWPAYAQALQQLGWVEGRNLHIDYRYALGNPAEARKHAAELVALAPDVIVAGGATGLAPLLQATRSIPLHRCRRPGWQRLCREPRPAGRQCHGIHPVRIQSKREVARAAQASRAGSDAGSGGSRCPPRCCDRPIRRYSVRGVVV